MYVGSDLNTVSSWYGQQKGNNRKAPASAEKTFYTAETPKVYQIYSQQIICCGQEVMVQVFLIALNMRMIRRMKIQWC